MELSLNYVFTMFSCLLLCCVTSKCQRLFKEGVISLRSDTQADYYEHLVKKVFAIPKNGSEIKLPTPNEATRQPEPCQGACVPQDMCINGQFRINDEVQPDWK